MKPDETDDAFQDAMDALAANAVGWQVLEPVQSEWAYDSSLDSNGYPVACPLVARTVWGGDRWVARVKAHVPVDCPCGHSDEAHEKPVAAFNDVLENHPRLLSGKIPRPGEHQKRTPGKRRRKRL